MLTAFPLLFSMFTFTGTTITFYECVDDPARMNRDLRVIEAPNGYKIVIRGVWCQEA